MCDGAPIDALREADLDDALALSAEAGWNQDAADWRLMLRRRERLRDPGRGARRGHGASPCPARPSLGWVSMVLVHGPYRRRGLATRLVERATATLTGDGLLPVLDATPAGAEVYGRMGYRPVAGLQRWRGSSSATASTPPAHDLAERVRDLDRTAFGADRGAILADLAARPAPVALLDPSGDGYLLSRAGRTATQLGPLVARDAATAVALLERGLDALDGTVVVDVPDARRARGGAARRARLRARAAVHPHGLRARRDRRATPALVHAIAGPELG